jgi:hypothetical protein
MGSGSQPCGSSWMWRPSTPLHHLTYDVGAPEGIRTPNLLIRSQMLYPLSYGRIFSFLAVAVPTTSAEAPGFEPGREPNPQPH